MMLPIARRLSSLTLEDPYFASAQRETGLDRAMMASLVLHNNMGQCTWI